MERRPEPELMDSVEQTVAYAEADFNEANNLFTSRFIERFRELPKRGRMADLGCGPGDIVIRMARSFPGWHIIGLDAGANMLQRAKERLAAEGLQALIEFRHSYLPDNSLPHGAFDAPTRRAEPSPAPPNVVFKPPRLLEPRSLPSLYR